MAELGPDTPGQLHLLQAPAVKLVRDVYGGTTTMRGAREEYLPRLPNEHPDDYEARLTSAVLYNMLKRTAKGLTGMVMRKPLAFGEDVPESFKARAENIDLAGRHIDTFTSDLYEDGQLDGHAHILVEFPRVELGPNATLTDERVAGGRPYWIALRKQDVLRFRTLTVNGTTLLVSFAYMEETTEPLGDFGEQVVHRIRQYDLRPGPRVEVRSWRRTAAKDSKWEIEGKPAELMIGRGKPFPLIPVTTFYTNRTGYMQSDPPLLDIAYENILHYQVRTDRMTTLHVAGVPIPIFIGRISQGDGDEIPVSVQRGIELPQGGDAKYLEPSGHALPHTRTELQDIEQRIAALGLSMLVRQSRAAETAEAKRIDKAETDSQLAKNARSLEDALEEAMAFDAMWMNETAGSINVNKDFAAEPLDPALLRVLVDMVGKGISLETLWDIMVAGEILPDSFDKQLERERLEAEGGESLEALLRLARAEEARRSERDDPDDDDGRVDPAA